MLQQSEGLSHLPLEVQASRFVIVPTGAMTRGLSAWHLALYISHLSYMNRKTRRGFPSLARVGARVGIGTDGAMSANKALVAADLLTMENRRTTDGRRQTSNEYHLPVIESDTFGIVPLWVFDVPGIRPADIALFAALRSFAGATDIVFRPQAEIAERAGMTTRNLRKALVHLQEIGVIVVTCRRGTRMADTYTVPLTPPVTATHEGTNPDQATKEKIRMELDPGLELQDLEQDPDLDQVPAATAVAEASPPVEPMTFGQEQPLLGFDAALASWGVPTDTSAQDVTPSSEAALVVEPTEKGAWDAAAPVSRPEPACAAVRPGKTPTRTGRTPEALRAAARRSRAADARKTWVPSLAQVQADARKLVEAADAAWFEHESGRVLSAVELVTHLRAVGWRGARWPGALLASLAEVHGAFGYALADAGFEVADVDVAA